LLSNGLLRIGCPRARSALAMPWHGLVQRHTPRGQPILQKAIDSKTPLPTWKKRASCWAMK